MEAQKDVERREGECQSERLPDSLASILAALDVRRQHDVVGRRRFLNPMDLGSHPSAAVH